MFVIADKMYSLESLKKKSEETISIDIEDWEKDIWSFLKIWFNTDIDFVEIKTSGSTGLPKTIRHQKKYMLASAEMTCAYFKLNKTHSALLCLSVKGIGGMMMLVRAFVSGMSLKAIKPSSNPLLNLNKSIDFVAMVPFQAQAVFKENINQWKWVKHIIIGGGIVSKQLKDDLLKQEVNAYSTFGMTETISHFALNKIGEGEVYTVLNNVSIHINKENCLVVSAPKLGVNELVTNDVVKLVNEKQFVWLGRKDLAIETGGIKVIPEILENKIEHLFDSRFFISAIPDVLLNNKLVLLIESKHNNFDLKSLKPFLTKYECPKKLIFINKFVETQTGKINRKETMNLLNDMQ